MIGWARTLAFRLLFYAASVPIVSTVPVSALFGTRAVLAHGRVWTSVHRWLMRRVLGIVAHVEGVVPPGQLLFAAKHQAMWETLELQLVLNGPAVVLKRELMRIPAWGWAARRYGAVPVDREASAAALRQMVRDAARIKATGRSVVVYPEGTRVAPGERPPLRAGFAGLYKALALPVVPIALDSGRLLPKRGTKRSGIITVRIGETVPPGLPRREAEARVHAAINALEPGAEQAPPLTG